MDYGQLLRREVATAWHGFCETCGTPPPTESRYDALCRFVEYWDGDVTPDPALCGSNVQGVCNSRTGIIRLNPDLSSNKRDFVLAHEIGHLVLKHPGRIADKNFHFSETVSPANLDSAELSSLTGLDAPAKESAFALRGYDERDRWETEANAFAVELLVPVETLRTVIESDATWTVAGLAHRFGVSRTHIYTQLAAALAPAPKPEPAHKAAFEPVDDASHHEAVHVPTPALIVAGPGSGKTKVLVERYARLVKEGNDPRRIFALTFANKAAGEMRERLSRLLGDDAGAAEVSTFHALGWQLLREYAHHLPHEKPLRLLMPADALLLLRPHIAKLPIAGFSDLRRPLHKIAALLSMVSRCKDENCCAERFAALCADSGDTVFYQTYHDLCVENGYVDYGDLVMLTLRLFDNPQIARDIRSRFDTVLVDEFQDINRASGLLVKALDGGRGVVWAVGDPKQSIYGFRGASPQNIARFDADYPGANRVALGTNYRSRSAIVAAGQAVSVASVPVLSLAAHRDTGGDEPCVTYAETQTHWDEAAFIANEIARLQTRGVALRNIAVLCRSRTCAKPIARALSECGVPHTWAGELEHRPLFKTMMAALCLATDDLRGIEGLSRLPESCLTEAERRALFAAAPRYGGVARQLLHAAIDGRVTGIEGRAMLALQRIEHIAQTLDADTRPFTNLSRYVFDDAVWFRDLLKPENRNTLAAREALATVRQTLMLAAHFVDRQTVLGASGDTTTAFLEWVQSLLETDGLKQSNQSPHGGDTDAVQLVTAHAAKGLEWQAVFVPGLAKHRFPSKPREPEYTLPVGVVESADADDAHAREEDCLFYVALTRARDFLYLTRARWYPATFQRQPSATLLVVLDTLRERGALHETIAPESANPAKGANVPVASPDDLPTQLLDTVSVRDLEQYGSCPRRYLCESVYGIRETGSAYLAFHGATTRAQSVVLARLKRGETVDENDANAVCAAIWQETGTPKAHWYAPFYESVAHESVQRFAAKWSSGDAATGLRYDERETVTLPATPNFPHARQVSVTIDEQETTPTGTIVRRRKFGRPPQKNAPTPDERHILYALHAEGNGGAVLVQEVYPRHDAVFDITFSPKVRDKRIETLHGICADIESGRFLATGAARVCQTCHFVLTCLHGFADKDAL